MKYILVVLWRGWKNILNASCEDRTDGIDDVVSVTSSEVLHCCAIKESCGGLYCFGL